MVSAQERINMQDESDDTADKAISIGKELGADKMNPTDKEELPDYEVVEEFEDKPLSKEREPRENSERKQLTNKEKRELRKKRVQEKFQQKDAIIEQQQQQLNAVVSRLNEVEGRISNVDRVKVDDLLNQARINFQQAEKDHMEAFKEGDGEKATRSMKTMYEAQRQIDQLHPIKQQYEKMPIQSKQVVDTSDAPLIQRKAKDWATKHDWYRADGSDEDSEIAKAISAKLVNDGFDPKSDDFWDELDDRLEKRGIGKQDEDEDQDEDEPAPRKRLAPPVSGGSKRGDTRGKVTVTLPTAYIQACKDAGKWDDETTRKRMIKRYLETQKNQSA